MRLHSCFLFYVAEVCHWKSPLHQILKVGYAGFVSRNCLFLLFHIPESECLSNTKLNGTQVTIVNLINLIKQIIVNSYKRVNTYLLFALMRGFSFVMKKMKSNDNCGCKFNINSSFEYILEPLKLNINTAYLFDQQSNYYLSSFELRSSVMKFPVWLLHCLFKIRSQAIINYEIYFSV
jgi:hypothetical protein